MIALTIRNGKAQRLPCVVSLSDKLILERIDRKNSAYFDQLVESNNFIRIFFGVDDEGDFSFDIKYDHLKFDQQVTVKRARVVDNEKENRCKKQKCTFSTGEALNVISENNIESAIDTAADSFDALRKMSPIKDLEEANKEQKVIENNEEIDNNDLPAPSTSQNKEESVENNPKSDHISDIEGLLGESVEEKASSEKRLMMLPITEEDIEDFGIDFFKKELGDQRIEVEKMSHAKRFWLAVKFSTNDKLKLLKIKRREMCDLFGISLATIKRYLPKKGNIYDYRQFNYLSPVEFEYTRQQHFFEKYASNYDALVDQGLFKKK